nr:hypothetical protein CFP56_33607 [Quercus suber]
MNQPLSTVCLGEKAWLTVDTSQTLLCPSLTGGGVASTAATVLLGSYSTRSDFFFRRPSTYRSPPVHGCVCSSTILLRPRISAASITLMDCIASLCLCLFRITRGLVLLEHTPSSCRSRPLRIGHATVPERRERCSA